jgi:hypothetical protein
MLGNKKRSIKNTSCKEAPKNFLLKESPSSRNSGTKNLLKSRNMSKLIKNYRYFSSSWDLSSETLPVSITTKSHSNSQLWLWWDFRYTFLAKVVLLFPSGSTL